MRNWKRLKPGESARAQELTESGMTVIHCEAKRRCPAAVVEFLVNCAGVLPFNGSKEL